MKTLSGALSAALGGPVQRPALLVQMTFAATQRWSSGGTITWSGQTWNARDMRMDALRVDALSVSGQLVLGNADGAIGALVLAEGVQDHIIRIWGFDAAATAAADVVWLADAVGAGAEIEAMEVRIALRHRCEFQAAPRTYVNAAAGFTHLLPEKTVININGQAYTLDRG